MWILYAKLVVAGVNVPKEVKTYCPKCKQHQAHSVTLYKAGKRRPLAKGERHHALRDKRGYGGQKNPLQRVRQDDQEANVEVEVQGLRVHET